MFPYPQYFSGTLLETEPNTIKSDIMKAIWNNEIIAESDETIVIERNHYFPPGSVKKDLLINSQTHTTCAWKGVASYYHIAVNGQTNPDAAWYYPDPKSAAENIKDYIAFWKGVKIED
jgi:uncharacterized protein (DUF427 family)